MRVLITGGGGQLAFDLVRAFSMHDVHAPARPELDIGVPAAVSMHMECFQPEIVINTAAFHQVDRCEDEPETAFAVNTVAVQRLAAACERTGALFIHISTNYVFDGAKGSPYVEDDAVNPLSVYGASKAAGEMVVRATTQRHLIVRTSGLYGLQGRITRHGNFVERMLRLAGQGLPISVVDDQVLTPSATVDVADIIRTLVDRGATGTYHITNSGQCSWYEFADTIFRLGGVRADLRATSQMERPMPARRPAFSVLAHEGLLRLGVPEPRPWHDALAEYMRSRDSL